MNARSLLVAVVLAYGVLFSSVAPAADADNSTTGAAGAAKAAPAMKPHSHMQEKLGVAPPATHEMDSGSTKKPNPWTDKSKHFHPRDK